MSQPAELVNVYRGGVIESIHYGSIAVVDSLGRLIAYAGDPHQQTFIRSVAKPFQAIPVLERGAKHDFDLSREEIAIMCASHGGEPKHVAAAAAILRKGEFDESDLLCGVHMPFDEKVAQELRQSGEEPSILQNNCSGKHAGMLLGTRLLDAPANDYRDASHPLQIRVRQTLADFADLADDAIPQAVDGCGVPSYYMSLYRAALAYARLGASARGDDAPGGLPRYRAAAKDVVEAMTGAPDHVGGRWSLTTPLMEAFRGGIIGKEGAEGFYSMLIMPPLTRETIEVLGVEEESSIGIAMKVSDGSLGRGRDPAIMHLLESMGIRLPDTLSPYRGRKLTNFAGTETGELRSEFSLTIL